MSKNKKPYRIILGILRRIFKPYLIWVESRITKELQTENIDSIYRAVRLYKKNFFIVKQIPSLFWKFEGAAIHLYANWMNGKTSETLQNIVSAIAAIKSVMPKSQSVITAYALGLYELCDLSLSEQEFLSLPEVRSLSPFLEDCYIKVLQQISIAKKEVNLARPKIVDLLILDNSFPSRSSSFRFGEFSNYLKHIENSSCELLPDLNMTKYVEIRDFNHQITEFCNESGIHRQRLHRLSSKAIPSSKVSYCVFLNNADRFFSHVASSSNHLIFTLYPGGGFAMQNKRSDSILKRLCDNHKVSNIITTQKTTYDYLTKNNFCEVSRIKHIYGGIVPTAYENQSLNLRNTKNEKCSFNICFVAQRYTPIGAEKGYDVFVKVVHALANLPKFFFHVVGDFDASVIDLRNAKNIKFYGARSADFFPAFYSSMDIIVSPIIQLSELEPNIPAYFDGFPTTCVIEAGLQGVAMFTTDLLKMNQHLDGTPIFSTDEIKIINRDASEIVDLIVRYEQNRSALHEIGQAGRRALLREFSFDKQMQPRLDLIKSYL